MTETAAFPDLDLMPDCSICDGPLEYDDGTFHCERCVVFWPRSGEGSEATSERRDADLCEARCPRTIRNSLYEGMFCEEELGHDGDHVIPARSGFGSPQREIRWHQRAQEVEQVRAAIAAAQAAEAAAAFPEQKLQELMQNLHDSVEEAKAARARHPQPAPAAHQHPVEPTGAEG